ncbi:uncharacterized protein LOC100680521 [Nasonia vitripennis]|uniref:Uncharacterized protein n=1 Tax=Nasonia vitripennis TaxID=7425 RepID=A0A7M7QL30_NASVI|nr:uncharacterized protein LOC100680521 [Nasonia vitripennis]
MPSTGLPSPVTFSTGLPAPATSSTRQEASETSVRPQMTSPISASTNNSPSMAATNSVSPTVTVETEAFAPSLEQIILYKLLQPPILKVEEPVIELQDEDDEIQVVGFTIHANIMPPNQLKSELNAESSNNDDLSESIALPGANAVSSNNHDLSESIALPGANAESSNSAGVLESIASPEVNVVTSNNIVESPIRKRIKFQTNTITGSTARAAIDCMSEHNVAIKKLHEAINNITSRLEETKLYEGITELTATLNATKLQEQEF